MPGHSRPNAAKPTEAPRHHAAQDLLGVRGAERRVPLRCHPRWDALPILQPSLPPFRRPVPVRYRGLGCPVRGIGPGPGSKHQQCWYQYGCLRHR